MEEQLFKIAQSPFGGSGVFADRNIAPYSIISSAPRPFFYAIDKDHLDDTCAWCFSRNTNSLTRVVLNKKCTGCFFLSFCSKECQRHAWREWHRYECKHLATGEYQEGTTDWKNDGHLRQLSYYMIRKKHRLLKKEESDTVQAMFAFRNNADEVQLTQGLNLAQLMRMIWDCEETISNEELVLMYQKVRTNSFGLTSVDGQAIGACLYPTIHLVNHSCAPNAHCIIDGPSMDLIAGEKAIRKDEEILIAYTRPSESYQWRQNRLKTCYGFECRCSRCATGPHGPGSVFPNPTTAPPAFFMNFMLKKASGQPQMYEEKFKVVLRVPDEPLSIALTMAEATARACFKGSFKAGDITLAIALVKDAMRWLANSRVWPRFRDPYPFFRECLPRLLQQASLFDEALRHAIVLHFQIYPIVYPDKNSWIRLTLTRDLLQLLLHFCTQPADALPFDAKTVTYSLYLYMAEHLPAYYKPHTERYKTHMQTLRVFEETLRREDAGVLVNFEANKDAEWEKFRMYGNVEF